MTPDSEATAEKFLRDKLESEIQTFGDGNTEFHTRDLSFLIECFDRKDGKIAERDIRHGEDSMEIERLRGELQEAKDKIEWHKKWNAAVSEFIGHINNLNKPNT